VSRDPLTTPELIYAVLEYLNVLLLMDTNALYFAVASYKRERRIPQDHRDGR